MFATTDGMTSDFGNEEGDAGHFIYDPFRIWVLQTCPLKNINIQESVTNWLKVRCSNNLEWGFKEVVILGSVVILKFTSFVVAKYKSKGNV